MKFTSLLALALLSFTVTVSAQDGGVGAAAAAQKPTIEDPTASAGVDV